MEKIIPFPDYASSENGDLALIKLKADLNLNDPSAHIRPICLPKFGEELDKRVGETCIATGWGLLSEGNLFLTTYFDFHF